MTRNPDDLLELANRYASPGDGITFAGQSQGAERYYTTEVFTEYNGHPVRIKFTEHDSSPNAYRYNATVYDAETGDMIATGNGGEDWQEALSIVHWRLLGIRWS